MPSTERQGQKASRHRASKACQRCNQKRVKCDAVVKGTPCTRCQNNGDEDSCALITSRRGRYERKRPRTTSTQEVGDDDDDDNVTVSQEADKAPTVKSPVTDPAAQRLEGDEMDALQADAGAPVPTLSASAVAEFPQHPQLAENPVVAEGPQTVPGANATFIPSGNPMQQVGHARSLSHGAINNTAGISPSQLPEYLRPIDYPTAGPGPPTTQSLDFGLESPESLASQTSNGSYREISWAAMFDDFLERRRKNPHDVIDKCSITYLGESFPLALVLEDLRDGGEKPRLHHPGPPLQDNAPPTEPTSSSAHPAHMQTEDIEFLTAKHAFDYPESPVLDALMNTFLERFYPLYPLVNRQEFSAQCKARSIPWILLHSCCFAAATYCPPAVLHRAGFTGRRQARYAYYTKAKALFDTGYEANKIVILQSVILLTFWGGGPNTVQNFYSWISTGVTIAETLGIHRSLARANMSVQDRRLLKRLWWLLVVRDASCGALVGRPFRISMDHCDAEMLTTDDFEHDMDCDDFAKHPLRHSYAMYQVQVAKLSLILRDVVTARFNRDKRNISMWTLAGELQAWKRDLPYELVWSEHGMTDNPLAATLSVLYEHHRILTHLGQTTAESVAHLESGALDDPQEVMACAAQQIAAVATSITMRSQLLVIPHELFSGIFLAGVVSYTQLKSTQPMMRQLGRAALSNCQLVLKNVQETYDPAPWLMNLFDRLLNHLREDTTTVSNRSIPSFDVSNVADLNALEGWMDAGQPFGGFDAMQTDFTFQDFPGVSQDNMLFAQPDMGYSYLSSI